MVDDDDNKMIVQKVKKKPYAMKKKISVRTLNY